MANNNSMAVFPHHEAMLMASQLEIATRFNPDKGEIEKYQRKLNETKIKKALANYNENIDNPVKVSFRDNHYYIFDGQHTKEMKLRRNGGKDLPIRCTVYTGMTYDDEATMFVLQNGEETKPVAAERLNASYQIGEEPITTIKNIVDSFGIEFNFERGHACDGKIVCYSSIEQIYKKYGSDVLLNALSLDVDIWNKNKDSLRKEIIYAFAIIYNSFANDENYDRKLFVRKMSNTNARTIIADGKKLSVGGMKRFALMMCEQYNSGNSKRFLDTNKLK